MIRAALFALALAPAAARADDTAVVALIDACIGAVGSPQDHAELCMGVYAERCMGKPAQTTAGLEACLLEESRAWGAIMMREYDALQPLLDPEQIGALARAQTAWEAFRDADCAFPQVFLRGSAARPWSADCVMQHTARRAMTLRGLIDYTETE